MNVASAGADPQAQAASINAKLRDAGATFVVDANEMNRLKDQVQEKTLFNRAGGASTLAVGMAQILSKVTHGRWLDIWYHFALMFEALFILTTLDAGTRVGRYLIQDALKQVSPKLGDTRSLPANVFASLLVVLGWGAFLIMGVRDPDGGIKALWPIFGIANQLLASIALCLATTVILKMQLGGSKVEGREPKAGRPMLALVTLVPLLWLLTVTITAGLQKVFHPEPRIGFLAAASAAKEKLPGLEKALADARAAGNSTAIDAAAKAFKNTRTLQFNNTVDALVTSLFLALVAGVFLLSAREWLLLIARKRLADLRESEAVWLPDYAVAEGKPLRFLGIFALALGLVRHLTDQAALDREQKSALTCACPCASGVNLLGEKREEGAPDRGELYATVVERRFNGVNRCC